MLEVVDGLIGDGGREIRFASAEAFRDFERAVAAMRAGVARSLVDDHGLSLTEVARRLNISRQAASRLYQSASELCCRSDCKNVTSVLFRYPGGALRD